MKESGSFTYTLKVLSELETSIREIIKKLGGNGIVVTMEMTTIKNKRLGIEEGITATVTWVYLDKPENWENKLTNYAKALSKKSNFPHYGTTRLTYNLQEVNLLSSLTAWTIKANLKQFPSIFGMDEKPKRKRILK